MQTQNAPATIKSVTELEKQENGDYKRWEEEITYAEKELEKFWKGARRVVRRYLDDRDATETNQKWYNIFYTNVGILKASLYDHVPTADVSRKFLDMNDDVARVAGNLIERCINQDMNEQNSDFDQVMRQSVWDRLVPGAACAWLRLSTETATMEDQIDPETEEPMEVVTHQEAPIDYVYWEDILWSPCRVWQERRWVARRVHMSRDKLVKRFGEKGKQVSLQKQSPIRTGTTDNNTPSHMVLMQGVVYEIWDREKREVIWYAKGMSELLDKKSDFLKLRDGRFEPCPRPLMANLSTSNCVPKPDYAMIQDQYNELDEVNNRISLLVIACKVVGVYDRSADGIQRMLTEGYDNILIPVDNWAMFAEKGGVKGQVDWLPLDVVVQALGQLQSHREALKIQIDMLTGISDVVRGTTKASETLGAQELKSKYASVRIQDMQRDIGTYATEILQIKADIICQHFTPEQIIKLANVANMPPEDQALVPAAMQLLKGNEEEFEWRIEIQASSMAAIDQAAVKQERSEFMNAVATFLQSASTVGQGAPQLIPLMLKMLQFGVAGFRVSKDIEGIFDKYIAQFEQEIEAKKNAPPQPDPEQQKMQMEMQLKQQDAQMKQQTEAAKLQFDAQKNQMELQQMAQKFQLELQQMQQEFAIKIAQMEREAEIKNRVDITNSVINAGMQQQEHEAAMERQEEQNNATESD